MHEPVIDDADGTEAMKQTSKWEPGAPVFDSGSQMVAVVHEHIGSRVILIRPSGLRWETRAVAVRRATDRELLQLKGLAKHSRNARALSAIGGRR
ncbi:hypothetical protein [Streptomyces sp. NPDC007172]|uniref:hypothetical protein n=1 Tax=Streptomyces sp. NPDC007172 TaxID=3364776 RepID=UPI0036961780